MKRQNIRVRIAWVFIFSAVILFLCSVFFVYAVFVQRGVRKNEEESNYNNVAFIQSMLDNDWETLFDYSLSILSSSLCRRLQEARTRDDFRQNRAYSLSREIQNHIIFDPMIEDICIYYPESDYVVGKKGVYPVHTYWASLYGPSQEISFDLWKESLFGSRASEYFILKNGNIASIYYRIGSEKNNTRLLVAKINPNTLEQRLQWVSRNVKDAFFAIADVDRYVITSTGDKETFVDMQTNQLKQAGNSYIHISLNASIPDLNYIVVAKKSSVYRFSNSVLRLTFLLLLFALVGSTIFSYCLIRRNVAPLEHIAGKLSNETGKKRNELDLISSRVDELLKDQNDLMALSKQHQIIICQAFLNELLRQDPNDKKSPETIAAMYDISLEYTHYAVIARARAESNEDEDILKILIRTEDTILVCWSKKDPVDVLLFCFDEDQQQLFSQLINQLRKASGKDAQIVCSNIVDTPLHIMECWINCTGQLGRYDLLPSNYLRRTPYHSDPSNTILEQFQRCLDIEEYSHAKQLVPEMFTQYVSDPDPFYFSYKKYFVIHILLPYAPEQSHQQFVRLSEATTLEEWTEVLELILDKCRVFQQSTVKIPESDIAKKVRNMIELQYSNPMLGLRTVSEEFGLSQSYISRLFKQKYGIGVSACINLIRIEHAKELIVNSNESIKLIALKVGFLGDSQFIRAFKRIENITPGNFRDKKLP